MPGNNLSLVILGTALLLLSACAAITNIGEDEDLFRMENGLLYRGDSSFTMRAVHIPDLAAKGAEVAVMAPPLVRIAECGANTLCTDLCGVSGDGSRIDPRALETITAYADRTKEQRMALIVRISLDRLPAGDHKRALRALAKACAPVTRAVYWLDGKSAEESVRLFKRVSPHLVVIAETGGDIRITDHPGDAIDSGTCLLRDAIPANPWGSTHFMLRDHPQKYEQIDAAIPRKWRGIHGLRITVCCPMRNGKRGSFPCSMGVTLRDGGLSSMARSHFVLPKRGISNGFSRGRERS